MNVKKQVIAWREPSCFGRTPLAMLCYLMTFFALSIFPADSYLPSLPFIQKHFAMSESVVQSTVTAFLIAMALGSLIFGPIAHRIGRRPTLVSAGIGFIIGSLVCVYAPNATYFLIGRAIQGLGATGFMTLARTILRDTFSGGQIITITSYTVPIISIVIAIAPTIGGYLQHWFGWQGTFWFGILIYLVTILFVLVDFPETTPEDHDHNVRFGSAYWTVIKSPAFVCFTTCTGLAMGFIMTYQTMAPLLLQTMLGLSPVTFGWLSLISCASMTLAAWVNNRLLDRLGNYGLLYLGAACLLTAGLLATLSSMFGYFTVAWIVLPFMLGLLGATLTFTNAFSGAMHPWPHLASFAAAVYNTWQYAVASMASGVAAYIPEHNQMPMGLIWLTLALTQCLVTYLACRFAKQSPASS